MTHAPIAIPSPQRMRRLTRIFPSLQGYTLLPFIPALAINWMLSIGLIGSGRTWVFVAFWLMACIGNALVSRWYARRFGEVRLSGAAAVWRLLAFLAVYVGVFWLLPVLLGRLFGMEPTYFRRDGPFAWPHVGVGLAATAYSLYLRPAMPYFWVLSVAILITAALPIGAWWPFIDGRHPFFHPYVGQPLAMAWLLAHALSSHRALIRLFPPPAPASEGVPA